MPTPKDIYKRKSNWRPVTLVSQTSCGIVKCVVLKLGYMVSFKLEDLGNNIIITQVN